jgi:cytochrome P450
VPKHPLEHPFHWLYGSAYALRDDVLEFYRRCEAAGGVFQTHVWHLPVSVVTDPELVEEILVKQQRCFIKSAGLRATQFAFGEGLLTADGSLWRRQRRIMQPAFSMRRLETYAERAHRLAEQLLLQVRDREVRDVHQDMTELCFQVLGASLFGEDLSAARPLISAAAESLHEFHHEYGRWIGLFGLVFAGIRAV